MNGSFFLKFVIIKLIIFIKNNELYQQKIDKDISLDSLTRGCNYQSSRYFDGMNLDDLKTLHQRILIIFKNLTKVF